MSTDDETNTSQQPPADTDLAGLKARLSDVIAERNAVRKEAATLREQAGKADEYRQAAEAATARLAAREAEWVDERAMVSAGLVDDEARDVARALYGRLPGEGRPATVAEWVASLRVEGATPPRALAPYLGGGGAPPVAAPPPRPSGNGQQPPVGGPADGAALRQAREAWVSAGRPSSGPTIERMRAVTDAATRRS